MFFNSQAYLLFFLLIFVVYWAMPWRQARVWLLLGASIYFYAYWNKWLALIVTVTTLADYFIARGMDAYAANWKRRGLLLFSLVMNLGLLVYFKYANFFLDSLESVLNRHGAERMLPILSVILPFGISFYTFEAINYTVDVYRRKIRAEVELGNFMLFILFFPHLVAGPIVRARDFLPQIYRRKRWSWPRMQLGVQIFLFGLFKKVAIADRMALFADPIFENPSQFNTGAVWLATLAYAVQIFCDFSGYTDMAIGSAHMLGYKLSKNFNLPYFAVNISDFWRRWHMSLSSWLRDYLFIPLGGSRGTNWQTNRNLMITMALGGLWHGASWTFVVWGILHGAYLIGHRSFKDFCEKRPKFDALLQTVPGTMLRMTTTFLCVCIGWVFFRSTTFTIAAEMLKRMFLPHTGLGLRLSPASLYVLVSVLVISSVLSQSRQWKWLVVRMPAPVLGFSYALILTLALVLTPDNGKAFIYFQF